MKRFRPSIAGLMAIILILAVECAAFRAGSEGWLRATYSLTALFLIVLILAARSFGPFWFGAAVFGWGYFLLGYGPWMTPAVVARYGTSMEEYPFNLLLVTAHWLPELCDQLVPAGPDREDHLVNCVGIAHSMLTLAFALVGGVLSVGFAAWSTRSGPPGSLR